MGVFHLDACLRFSAGQEFKLLKTRCNENLLVATALGSSLMSCVLADHCVQAACTKSLKLRSKGTVEKLRQPPNSYHAQQVLFPNKHHDPHLQYHEVLPAVSQS